MQIARRKPLNANIGIIGIGHYNYWDQFEGLRDSLVEKQAIFRGKVDQHSVTSFDYGLIDCAQHAYDAVKAIKKDDLDLLFVDMVTYGTSSTFGVIAREMQIPIVLVALQPLQAMDYENATTYVQLQNDDFCSVPEFTGVAIRMGRQAPEVILGTLHDDPAADKDIEEWCRVAHALHDLKNARIGHFGHTLESMLDMHTDPTAITSHFGSHVVQCEPHDVMKHYKQADATAVDAKKKEILAFFDTPVPVSDPLTEKLTDEDLHTAAEVALALEAFIDEKDLDGLAYYYEGLENTDLRTVVTNFIVGNSLLTGAGFPMCGEYDLKTCMAMLIMDRLDIGGSFAEFHPIDFKQDTVLVGHDGPHHLNIADGQPVIRSLKKYHGKPGKGASVEFKIKVGPITMLSIGMTYDGKFKFVVAEGESIDGPIPPTGNTNTHGKFKPDVRTFLKSWVAEGPTHHFALGIGHHAHNIKRVADALGIECVNVTQ